MIESVPKIFSNDVVHLRFEIDSEFLRFSLSPTTSSTQLRIAISEFIKLTEERP
jgi:hypothetical protein